MHFISWYRANIKQDHGISQPIDISSFIVFLSLIFFNAEAGLRELIIS
jgi:hypothetical protein